MHFHHSEIRTNTGKNLELIYKYIIYRNVLIYVFLMNLEKHFT